MSIGHGIAIMFVVEMATQFFSDGKNFKTDVFGQSVNDDRYDDKARGPYSLLTSRCNR